MSIYKISIYICTRYQMINYSIFVTQKVSKKSYLLFISSVSVWSLAGSLTVRVCDLLLNEEVERSGFTWNGNGTERE